MGSRRLICYVVSEKRAGLISAGTTYLDCMSAFIIEIPWDLPCRLRHTSCRPSGLLMTSWPRFRHLPNQFKHLPLESRSLSMSLKLRRGRWQRCYTA